MIFIKTCYQCVSGLTGTGSSRWSDSPVLVLAGEVVHRSEPTGSTVMNINRYGRSYRTWNLSRKVQGELCEDHLYPKEYWETPIWPHDHLWCTFKQRFAQVVRPAKLNTRSTVVLVAGIDRNWRPSSFLPITALLWIAGIWSQSCISSLVFSVSDICGEKCVCFVICFGGDFTVLCCKMTVNL